MLVRSEVRKYTPDGTLYEIIQPLTLEFALHNGEYDYVDAEGRTERAADIRGHFANIEEQGRDKEWTDEEIEVVRRVMARQAKLFPGEMWAYEAPRIPAPWPKYDETPYAQIATTAEATGTTVTALEYERQNKARASVVKELEKLVAAEQAAAEELAAA